MLIDFKFSNYRSFKDETTLSMQAVGLSDMKNSLLEYGSKSIVPAVAIYGKNGAGKSNVIRAFWLAVQFVKNAQRTQHDNAPIPITPFLLDDTSKTQETSFEFIYTIDNVKYTYGFSATTTTITREYLEYSPKTKKASIFDRYGQTFIFPKNSDKKLKELIKSAVGANQLYFSVACTMNYKPCIDAMKWFRENISFSRDFSDIPEILIQNFNDKNMLNSIVTYAKQADVGINDMSFEFENNEINDITQLPDTMPDELKSALSNFIEALSSTANNSESAIRMQKIKAKSFHSGIDSYGQEKSYELELSDESEGTKRLMSLAPAIEKILMNGGLLLIDEIEKEMHPILVEYIVSKFQSNNSNKTNAQLIFTTHETQLLELEYLRKDQIYFTDKNSISGISKLYRLTDFSTPTNINIRKSYLLGKFGATPHIDIEEVE